MTKVIAHIDMDCFYCSCEELKDPDLKGKPVIVGSIGKRGVVSTSNYVARRYGVFSATPISKARNLCPNGIFLPSDMKFYKKKSDEVMKLLSKFSKKILKASIDEAYLDLTELAEKYNDLYELANHLKETIYRVTGLTCSIGISESKIVSKIASDYLKPNGVTIVQNNIAFLSEISIKKVPGIGKVAFKAYKNMGINTIGDFLNLDPELIKRKLGDHSLKIWGKLRGSFETKFYEEPENRSISYERTFENNIRGEIELNYFCEKLIEKFEKKISNTFFRKIGIKIRYSNFKTISREISLNFKSNDLSLVREKVKELIKNNYSNAMPVRLIGVKLSDISLDSRNQLKLSAFA